MATRASKGESKECLADGIDLLVNDICLFFDFILFRENLGAQREESRRCQLGVAESGFIVQSQWFGTCRISVPIGRPDRS